MTKDTKSDITIRKHKPSTDALKQSAILLYAPTKFGKTTIANQFPKTLFLATEAGQNFIEADIVDCKSWGQMVDALRFVMKEDHGYETIVIDSFDAAYELCRKHVLHKHAVVSEADLGAYGKGYSLVREEYMRIMSHFMRLPVRKVLIGACKGGDVRADTGVVEKFVPAIPQGVWKDLKAIIDIVLFGNFDESNDRIIHTKPTAVFDAGDRTAGLPPKIEMRYTALADALKKCAARAKPKPTPTKENKK